MRKAYLHLLKKALKDGYQITIFDGEEKIKCTGYLMAKERIEAVDESYIHIYSGKEEIGSALVVLDSEMEPEETVADYSCTDYMNDWDKEYSKGQQ